MIFIEARYGGGITAYFAFFRFLVLAGLALGLIILGFHGYHFFKMTDSETWGQQSNEEATLTPRWLLYGSFFEEASLVELCNGLILFILISTSMRKLVDEDKLLRQRALQEKENDEIKYSQLAFTMWDCNIFEGGMVEDQKEAIIENFKVFLDEKKREEEKKLLQEDKVAQRKLFARRTFSLFIMFIIIMVTWALLVVLNAFSATIESTFSSLGSLNQLVPSLSINFINFVMPLFAQRLTAIEQWTDPVIKIKAETLRLYLLKIFTVVLLMVQFYQTLASVDFFAALGFDTGTSVTTTTQQCPENSVGNDLFTLILTSFFVAISGDFGGYVARYILSRWIKKQKSVPRKDFNTAKKVINLIYFQALIWITVPYMPSVIPIGAVMMYIIFKFDKFYLQKFLQKPRQSWSAKDTGAFFMLFYMSTFSIALIAYYYQFTVNQHTCDDNCDRCGPHVSTTLMDAIKARTQETPTTDFIYGSLVTNPLFVWGVLCLLILSYQKRGHQIFSLQDHTWFTLRKHAHDIERKENLPWNR